ncbi:hypothetical protein ACO0QE_001238 [Hanseniaspora vineae]
MAYKAQVVSNLHKNHAVVVTVQAHKHVNKLQNDSFFFEECLRLLPLNNGVLKKRFFEDQVTILLNRLLQLWGSQCAIGGDSLNNKLRFSRGPYGKPVLTDHHPQITFSMTNGKLITSMFITRDVFKDVGIDIASVEDHTGDDFDVFNDILSPEEIARFQDPQIPAVDKKKLFARIWSIKESYTKFTGQGLNCDLQKISLPDVSPTETVTVKTSHVGTENNQMTFVSRWIDPSNVLTVCYPFGLNIDPSALNFLSVDLLDVIHDLQQWQ